MNTVQRCVIVAGVLAIVGAGLYPSWTGTIGMIGDPKTMVRRSAGYHSIFTAPGPTDKTTYNNTFGDIEDYDAYRAWHGDKSPRFRDTLRYEIDSSRLLLEWLMVVLVTAGLVLASKYKAPTRTASANTEDDLSESQRTLKFRLAVLRHLRSPRTYILLLSTVACLAITYYFVIALPRHNRAALELERERIEAAEVRERAEQERQRNERQRREDEDRETKRVQEQARRDALLEHQKQREACDSDADAAYTAYVRRYGTWVEDEQIYHAAPSVWDTAEKLRKTALAYCYKRYGLR